MKGRNIVFWSGGQDSTLVALQLLRAGKYIKLVSFDNCWIGGEHQQNLEKMRRKQILNKFQAEFGGNSFDHKNFTWDGELIAGLQSKAFVSLYPLCCKDEDNVYLGIMSTDNFWHYANKWKIAFEKICDCDDKKVELNFPLEWFSRKAVIKDLKKLGYYDLTIHSGDKL